MTFLDPMAGLIGAAVSVPVLIALYLLKLRRKPVRVTSTLLWEQAVQDLQANVPLRWLRWSWLLAIQLLGLGALLIALARPAVPGQGGGAERAIIIIDCSASMNARDGVRRGSARGDGIDEAYSRLDEAKQAARGVVEELRRSAGGADGRRPEAAVIAMAGEARALTRMTSDHRDMLEAIDAIEPTDQPASLESALDLARAMVPESASNEDTPLRTRVLIVSDGSTQPLSPDRGLPGGMDFRLVPVGPDAARDGADNLGIVALAARRDLNQPAKARVFVRVLNASRGAIETAVTLRVNDQPSGIVTVPLPGATTDAGGTLVPGEGTATFDITQSDTALISVAIPRDDLLSSDNAAAAVLRSVRPPRVLVIGPGPEASDPYASARGPQGVDRFLLAVLRAMELPAVRVQSLAQYEAAMAAARSGDSNDDSGADLYIFDRASPSVLPDKPSVHIGASAAGLGVRVEPAKPDAPSTRFAIWQRSHPLLRGVPLDAVLIAPPMQLNADESTRVSWLAEGSDGPLIAIVEAGSTRRKRLVLGFDLLRTNWGGDVSFPVFVASMVEHLTARGDAGASVGYSTTEPIAITPARGVDRLTLRGPLTREASAPASAGLEGTPVAVGALPRAGVYVVDGAAPEEDAVVCTNLLSPLESTLAVQRSIPLGGGNRGAIGLSDASERPAMKEVWPIFVLIAAALLSLEWVLYARKMRL